MNTPRFNNGSIPRSTYSEFPNAFSDNTNSTGVTDAGYFPPARTHRGSTSSSSSSDSEDLLAQPSRSPTTSSIQSAGVPVDPLSRNYPKPTEEINVAEALARKPRKWTIGYWAKNAKETQVPVQSKETQSKKFEEAKKELLKAKAEMAELLNSKR